MFQKIRKNIEFLNVYRHGKSYANKYLVMYVLNNKLDENRFGITVSKKVGNSVVRHRITRLIRECIRLQESNILTEYDIVIVARKAAKDKKYQDIESAFLNLCKRQNILKR
ncbi:ribonuclease P protein component [Clostridium sp. CAG:277]|nr:ribonuclease P protein component [Clostridium sp. CAG:277]